MSALLGLLGVSTFRLNEGPKECKQSKVLKNKNSQKYKDLAATLSLEINLKDKADLPLIPQHLEPRIPDRRGKKQGVQFSTTSIVGDQRGLCIL